MLVQLRTRAPDAKKLAGKVLGASTAKLLLTGDCDVYKPDGEPLVLLRRGALDPVMLDAAYPALHALRAYKTDNRGAYTGLVRVAKTRFLDGSKSKSTRTMDEDGKTVSVASAVVGYFDKQGGRFPFCRETAFTAKEVAKWRTLLPMARVVDGLFSKLLPVRHTKQLEACACAPSEFTIAGTAFTTLTVNNNVAPSGVHKDKGDFKHGFGIISVVRRGEYEGALLLFPEYYIGVDLQHGDVLFFNSHDWHGVTPMVKKSEDAERISVVYYMRAAMVECRPPGEQLEALRGQQGLG